MKLILAGLLVLATATTSLPLKAVTLTPEQQLKYVNNLINLEQWQRLETLITGPIEWTDETKIDLGNAVLLALKALSTQDLQAMLHQVPTSYRNLSQVLYYIYRQRQAQARL